MVMLTSQMLVAISEMAGESKNKQKETSSGSNKSPQSQKDKRKGENKGHQSQKDKGKGEVVENVDKTSASTLSSQTSDIT